MEYPKVLIVGQYFNIESGGGITMTNLFMGWDKKMIAVAATDIQNPDFTVCDNCYYIGSLETKSRFPFNLNPFKKKLKSGKISHISKLTSFSFNQSKVSKIKKLYFRLLHISGLFHYKRRYVLSNDFLSWIKDFSPDIIYTQLSNIELIELVGDIHSKLNLPIAIHIMDDWPVTISETGFFQSYWAKVIDEKFRKLLFQAKILMSISESMSEEYKKRYGLDFVPFHNPIDIEHWGRFSKKSYERDKKFTILYAGRIGTGIRNCFFDIIEAIKSLNSNGLEIELIIQATNFDPLLDELRKFSFVKINPSVTYSELPAIFSNSDVLLLPNDFDDRSIKYLKYSMPTKASEYMVSGTPILLYSSIETAVTRHALKYKWSFVVSERNKEKLKFAISELYKNKHLRSELGNIARQYALNNFDSRSIKEQFKKSFIMESRRSV
jgi:glycosyltransferase involved in cell wall biosynthesis